MNTVTTLGRLLISLAFVLIVMWLIARKVGGKKGRLRGKSNRLIDVLGRQQLSRTASVAVVQVMDQALIVGITDGQVTVLGETDLAAAKKRIAENQPVARPKPSPAARLTKAPLDAAAPKPLAGSALSPATWRQTVNALRDLTVRTR
jgi:flagellar protein FliO/FliZ